MFWATGVDMMDRSSEICCGSVVLHFLCEGQISRLRAIRPVSLCIHDPRRVPPILAGALCPLSQDVETGLV